MRKRAGWGSLSLSAGKFTAHSIFILQSCCCCQRKSIVVEEMAWNHPDISLEEMIKSVKGFVDILILSSGYQSSGAFAQWDVTNIRKAFQWAVFFETVFIPLKSSKHYEESLEALDGALSELKSDASFPGGLAAHLSSDSLIRSRNLIMHHMLHSLSLRDSHLKVVLTAVVQMDLDVPSESVHDHLIYYLDKLSFQIASVNLVQDRTASLEKPTSYSETGSVIEVEKLSGSQWTNAVSSELLKRLSSLACISSLYTGLDTFARAIGSTGMVELVSSNMVREQLKHGATAIEDQIAQYISWYGWKSRSLLYFLDKRTIRLVSGARMMFSSPKSQWLQALEKTLGSSGEQRQKNFRERVEILLLGCIADRWNIVIKHFQSVRFSSVTTFDGFYAICNLLHARCQGPTREDERINSKGSTILSYLTNLVGTDLNILWMLSPALSVAAIPSWSPLFRLYLNQIETHLREESPLLRPCGCTEEKEEHKDCELAERIWCLYVVHISGCSTSDVVNK